jgi:MFS transporter, DHA2 family, multidrug resistance protein
MKRPADPPSIQVAPRTWLGFAMMGVGMFMAILDIQVVATSLPSIQAALAIAPERMSWIQTAYLIAEIVAIPLTGILTRLLGMRLLFVASISLFTLASAGCGLSSGFEALIFWRVIQGFAGGSLIPAVFSAVFLLFPPDRQGVATTIAGVLAVLAPTLGPVVGGWVTETWSWQWLFFINVIPGVLSAVVAGYCLPRGRIDSAELRRLDVVSLLTLAIALASLEIGLKEAPDRGWFSGPVFALLALSAMSAAAFVGRSLRRDRPIADLRLFRERNFAAGCALSFLLGMGLFGSVYLMPVFLAFVRDHDALQIGKIMLVTGIAQLLLAPVAVQLDRRVDPRLLSAVGFLTFGTGLALSAFQTPQTDFAEMFWPQVIRGAAIMFCLLPPTRLALGQLDERHVPDGSGLFNLMRNLGGAIGIALIDTVVYGRAPAHGEELLAQLQSGNAQTAAFVGISLDDVESVTQGSIDIEAIGLLQAKIEKAALVLSMNEAWAMLAVAAILGFFVVAAARKA